MGAGAGNRPGYPSAAAESGKLGFLRQELVDDAMDLARLRGGGEGLESGTGGARGERLPEGVVDELMAGARTRGRSRAGWAAGELTRRLVERALEVEPTEHLGYEPPGASGWGGEPAQRHQPKTVLTDTAPFRWMRPGSGQQFEPQLVRKGQRRLEGLDEKILALYAGGMSTRDIEAHLRSSTECRWGAI